MSLYKPDVSGSAQVRLEDKIFSHYCIPANGIQTYWPLNLNIECSPQDNCPDKSKGFVQPPLIKLLWQNLNFIITTRQK